MISTHRKSAVASGCPSTHLCNQFLPRLHSIRGALLATSLVIPMLSPWRHGTTMDLHSTISKAHGSSLARNENVQCCTSKRNAMSSQRHFSAMVASLILRSTFFLVINITSSSNRKRFYRRRLKWTSRGYTCPPFTPPRVPSFLSRIGFSIPFVLSATFARRLSWNFSKSRSRAFLWPFLATKGSYEHEYALGEI